MTETTQEERDEWRARGGPGTWNGEHGRRLLNDADRLAAIERQVRELAFECDLNGDPSVWEVGGKLRAILDSPEGA